MDPRYIKKHSFFKILLWHNPHSNSGIFFKTIELLQQANYDVYIIDSFEDAQKLIGLYSFSLVIVDLVFFNDSLKELLQDLPIIAICGLQDLEKFQRIMHHYTIIDYFLLPIDNVLLMTKINFFLQQKTETVHFLKRNLITYLWEAKLYQEEKLHNAVWDNENNYNHYMLTKLSQFIVFFSHILCLIEDFFIHTNMSFEGILKKITNVISLQTCFFNCYITFQINNNHFPPNLNENGKNFLLFLVFIGELCKSTNNNIDIVLNFEEQDGEYIVALEIPQNLTALIMTYNDMYLDSNNLFHFIQQYLWQHWKKKISFQTKSGKISVIEIFLKNKHSSK